mgnify:CR=1 FL=1
MFKPPSSPIHLNNMLNHPAADDEEMYESPINVLIPRQQQKGDKLSILYNDDGQIDKEF